MRLRARLCLGGCVEFGRALSVPDAGLFVDKSVASVRFLSVRELTASPSITVHTMLCRVGETMYNVHSVCDTASAVWNVLR